MEIQNGKSILPLPTKLARNFSWLIGGTTLAQAIVILCAPLLTRLYSPREFGVYGVYSSILTILLVIASLRYESAIPLPEDDDTSASLLLLSLIITCCLSCLCCILVILLQNELVIRDGIRSLYTWVIPVGLIASGFYQSLNYWSLRKEAFNTIARTKLSQAIGQVFIQIALGLVHIKSGIFMGDIAGRSAGIGSQSSLLRSNGNWIFTASTVRKIPAVAKRYMRFPLITMWAGLLNVASLQIPSILLGHFYSGSVVGFYTLAYRALGLPMSVLGQSVGQVYFSRAVSLRNHPNDLAQFTQKMVILLFGVGLPICGEVFVSGRQLFEIAFGETWADAGVYASVLAPWFLIWMVASPLSNILIVREWQATSFLFTLFEFGTRIGAVYLGSVNWAPITTIYMLSLSGVVIATLSVIRFLRAGYTKLTSVSLPLVQSFVLSIPFFLVEYLLTNLQLHRFLNLVLYLLALTLNLFAVCYRISDLRHAMLSLIRRK